MRTFLLISNATVAVIFTLVFAYTFLGRRHIDDMAREFVTAKTQEIVTPTVDVAEEALRSDLVRRFLPADQIAIIESEIAEFRSQPTLYIQRLTSAHPPTERGPTLSKATERIYGWKERIRTHYNRVLRRLFTDLRIFSGSNVVGACIAFVCAWCSPGRPTLQLKLVSALLLAAIGLASYSYIDDFSFFTILFDWYLGWAYPVLIGLLFIAIYVDYVRARKALAADG
jgi:hypothetical protein